MLKLPLPGTPPNTPVARLATPVAASSRFPHPLVDPETHEPAEQKVELQLLHQLALRADRIESLQKKRP